MGRWGRRRLPSLSNEFTPQLANDQGRHAAQLGEKDLSVGFSRDQIRDGQVERARDRRQRLERGYHKATFELRHVAPPEARLLDECIE